VRYLFVHQNFPAQYLHLVRHLCAQRRHEVVFVCEPNANHLAGVRKLVYRLPRIPLEMVHPDAREFALAQHRAGAAAQAIGQLKTLGFVPDIIIGHHGWGELLNMQDVFPGTPMLGYFEFFYHTDGVDVGYDPEFPLDPAQFPRVRAKNAVNLLALALPGRGQTPTAFQRETYPEWARPRIEIIPEGVDLEACSPDPAVRRAGLTEGTLRLSARQKLVTYVARDLEPYRGFHVLMRALPAVLKARADVQVAIVGSDGVSYGAPPPEGSWRAQMLAELRGAIDPDRVHFLGRVPYEAHLRLLRRSDAHVYLTYPFVASWSLREALAVGCAVIGADTPTVQEFIAHGANGLLTPGLDPVALSSAILGLLEDGKIARTLRAGARAYAETHLSLDGHIAAFEAVIARLTGREAPANA